MNILTTPIPGLLIIEPDVFADDRGHFLEVYNYAAYSAAGIGDAFVQDNEAWSKKGVLRGLHYQVGSLAQSKLVRVTYGAAWDVAVDLRAGSPTLGQWFGLELSASNKRQFYIPRGFAHGYLALEEGTVFCYKCDNFYSREHEGGIRFDDLALAIAWPVNGVPPVVSDRDLALPAFGDHLIP